MTSILAQTVYGLNLLELPLDKLEKGDHIRGSLRATSGKELHVRPTIRLDSFSAISDMPSIRHVQRRDTTDGRIKHTPSKGPRPHLKLIGKTSSELEPHSPEMDGHPGHEKRGSLPSSLTATQTKTTSPSPLISVKEVGEDSVTPVPSPEPPVPPLRSITTSTLVSDKLAKERQVLLNSESTPSPGAVSLPAEFILEDRESIEGSSHTCFRTTHTDG